MSKGTIGVTTTNIFPVIKKFLYSDHEIFLRELVSNAVDAIQKLKTLEGAGEYKGSTEGLKVEVKLDKEAGTLTVSDNGIGMTAEEVDKYINEIAFSGAEEFLNKYKDSANAIIGHFGLGFYSAFMVAKKVEIHTLSFREGAKGVTWTCDGSPEFEMTESDRAERGTDIVLHIADDEKEFLEKDRIDGLLKKYCRFLPVTLVFGKEQEWDEKDKKYADTDRDNVINNVEPLWTRTPTDLKDEDYIKFYHAIQPGQDDPLFWIHLNVDYPFTLTGILYFPKIKNNLDIRKDRIQLFCNQVFVTDSVEGVVPEFMTLLQGVIDSPDIPLNVSRSYLQADRNVKKISSYITKKVASRLEEIAKNQPEEFEKKWDDIKIFIEYGMLSDEKFCDAAMKFALLRDTEGKYMKIADYRELVKGEQTDKNGDLVLLYSTDAEAQYTYIQAARNRGYSVLAMDGELDIPFMQMLEHKGEKTRCVRVDSDVLDKLIAKDNQPEQPALGEAEKATLTTLFDTQLPQLDKCRFIVACEPMQPTDQPVIITQNEFMRRMKDMARFQPGMSFYGDMPSSYTLTLNTSHPLVKRMSDDAQSAVGAQAAEIEEKIKAARAAAEAVRQANKDAKEMPDDQQKAIDDNEAQARRLGEDKRKLIADYAATQNSVKQLIDIALLGNGLLKGEALNEFLKRSVELL